MDGDYSIELDRFRVVHAPSGCVFSFPEKVRATALDIWQVVSVGDRAKYGPDSKPILKRAFELYVEAKRLAEQQR
jgi:hypothetical protein